MLMVHSAGLFPLIPIRTQKMLRYVCALGLFILAASTVAANPTALPGLIRAPLSVPIALPDGHQVTLEGLAIRPDRPGKFPLIILVHGSPRSEPGKALEAYRRASPTGLAGPALAFAQHGYAAVSIMRRGFGRSDGPYAEFIADPCENTDYLRVGLISAEDISGAVATLRREPWVDPDRVVLLGYSTGGLAVTAAGATNPPGVLGILDFAGGRGSFKPDQVCSPDRLTDAFAAFGRSSRIPALWLFAENDHYLGLALGRRMFEAYTAAGGPAQLQVLPPFGTDGHSLLLAGSTDLWWPSVETFLGALHLPTSLAVELPPPSSLPPPQVNDACLGFFRDYVAARTDAKAFAVNPEGHCRSEINSRSLDDAKEEAMTRCIEAWKDCKLYAVGQALVERTN
jgi:dienelactone hydrolase